MSKRAESVSPARIQTKVNYLIMSPDGEVHKLNGTLEERIDFMEALGLDLENGCWAFAQQHSYDLYWQVCASDGDMQTMMRKHLREHVRARPCDIRVR